MTRLDAHDPAPQTTRRSGAPEPETPTPDPVMGKPDHGRYSAVMGEPDHGRFSALLGEPDQRRTRRSAE